MATKTLRKIIHIDEEKCDGCGLCVPSCEEGAIQIIDGKAKLVAENLATARQLPRECFAAPSRLRSGAEVRRGGR